MGARGPAESRRTHRRRVASPRVALVVGLVAAYIDIVWLQSQIGDGSCEGASIQRSTTDGDDGIGPADPREVVLVGDEATDLDAIAGRGLVAQLECGVDRECEVAGVDHDGRGARNRPARQDVALPVGTRVEWRINRPVDPTATEAARGSQEFTV